jgi:hypothetical protein
LTRKTKASARITAVCVKGELTADEAAAANAVRAANPDKGPLGAVAGDVLFSGNCSDLIAKAKGNSCTTLELMAKHCHRRASIQTCAFSGSTPTTGTTPPSRSDLAVNPTAGTAALYNMALRSDFTQDARYSFLETVRGYEF